MSAHGEQEQEDIHLVLESVASPSWEWSQIPIAGAPRLESFGHLSPVLRVSLPS